MLRSSKTIRLFLFFEVTLLLSSFSVAALLTDADMYCDPWSVPVADYPKIHLDSLNTLNYHSWSAGSDPIVSAKVLPLIKEGTYQQGYAFSSSDYYLLPNVDYFADLTGGMLTTTFNQAGVYHVNVQRESGLSQIYAVLAQSSIANTETKTGASKKIGIPDADLFIVSDSAGDDSYEERSNRVLTAKKKTVQRATTVQQAIDAITSLTAPPKKHVELVGHGNQGYISIGNGPNYTQGDKILDDSNAATFRDAVKAKVSHLTFLSCNTGGGTSGKDLIDTLDDGISKVEAYDSIVNIIEEVDNNNKTTGGYFTVDIVAQHVPEPSSLFLILAGAIGIRKKIVSEKIYG